MHRSLHRPLSSHYLLKGDLVLGLAVTQLKVEALRHDLLADYARVRFPLFLAGVRFPVVVPEVLVRFEHGVDFDMDLHGDLEDVLVED